MDNYIFTLLKEGHTMDEIKEILAEMMTDAEDSYNKYVEEQKRKEEEARKEKEALELKKQRQEQARDDLKAAYINYLDAYGITLSAATLEALDSMLERSFGYIPGKRYVIKW